MKKELLDELKKIKKDFQDKNYKKQLPNILTSLRLLAPFVLIPLFYYNKLIIAFITIVLFALTDTFDGYFARKYNSISKFGKYLDTVVDKVFALSILISLMLKMDIWTKNFNLNLTIALLEIIICIINLYAFFKKLKPSSTIYGKLKTWFLFGLLVILFLSKIININDTFRIIYTVLIIILQIIAIISYLLQVKTRKKEIGRQITNYL